MAQANEKRRSPIGQIRVIIAWICTLGALAFAAVGLVNPALIGLENNPGVFYLTAPPLVIAALIHLYLVTMGTRRPSESDITPKNSRDEGYNPSARTKKV